MGRPLRRAAVLDRARKKVGFEWVGFHDFRHRGVDLRTVQELMGHDGICKLKSEQRTRTSTPLRGLERNRRIVRFAGLAGRTIGDVFRE